MVINNLSLTSTAAVIFLQLYDLILRSGHLFWRDQSTIRRTPL